MSGASSTNSPSPADSSRSAETTSWFAISTPGAAWRYALGTLGGVFLGAVFLVATWAKVLDPQAFAEQISREGLDFLVPAPALALFALALEAFLGGALVLGVRKNFILWPMTVLVVFFLFLTGRTYWQDLQGTLPADTPSCGCFGNLVERTPAEAFWQDLLLMVPALVLAFLGRRREPFGPWRANDGLPLRRLAAVTVLAVAILFVGWKAPELPLDDLATRLRPGIDPLALCVGQGETETCMDAVLPELGEGKHVVVLAELDGEELLGAVETLNDFHLAGGKPSLWVVTSATEEQLFEFRFGHGPAFEIREAPPALLAPLYRRLPRSFYVEAGEVKETWSGLPPLERF